MSEDESPNGSSATPAAVQGAEWLPSLGGARLVRIRGVGAPTAAASGAAPVLVMEGGGAEQSVEALPESRFARGEEGWAASFLVPGEAGAGGAGGAGPASAWLQWPDGSRLSVPVTGAAAAPAVSVQVPAEASGDTVWQAHRSELEAELSRTASALAVAREDAEAASRRSAAAARESDDLAAAAHERLQEATAAAAAAESRAAVETLARHALEAEMSRRAAVAARVGESLAAEREARLALGRSLAETRAELGAVRSARAADQSQLETMTAERDAERTAATVARGTVADLRGELAGARAGATAAHARADALEGERADALEGELTAAREEASSARAESATARSETQALRERLESAAPVSVTPRRDLGPGPEGVLWSSGEGEPGDGQRAAADPDLLRRLGLAQAAAAAAARGAIPDESAGRMLSDLDAAAAALRRALPGVEPSADAAESPAPAAEEPTEPTESAASATPEPLPAPVESVEPLEPTVDDSIEHHAEASSAIREALESALAEHAEASEPTAGTLEERAEEPGAEFVPSGAAPPPSPASDTEEPVGEDGATVPAPPTERGAGERGAVAASAAAPVGEDGATTPAEATPPATPDAEAEAAPPAADGSEPVATEGVEASLVDAPVQAPAPVEPGAVSPRALEPGDARPLRHALAAFAELDPVAAGQLMIELLPAQGVVLNGSGEGLSYDLTIDGVGTFGVIVGNGRVEVADLPSSRPRSEASFHLRGAPLAFAQVLAGEKVKVGRFTGKLRASGRRRELWPLHALPSSALSLADAVQAGARPSPGPAYGVLAHAIDPAWTRGHAFTIAQVIEGRDATTVYVTARDGQRLGVSLSPPAHDVAAKVEMSRETFDCLLAGEQPPHGARPTVRGDREAVALLKSWTDRALRAGE